MLSLLSPPSPRLQYTADLVFSRLLGIDWQIVPPGNEVAGIEGPVICYGVKPFPGGLFIPACGLLAERGIREIRPEFSDHQGMKILFPGGKQEDEYPFDIFSAIFWLVSRYEEYLIQNPDKYGRFRAEESILTQHGLLEVPVVNLWAEHLRKALASHFPSLRFSPPPYRYIPTVDIDHAWCYKGRSLFRTAGGFIRSLMKGRFGEVVARASVIAGVSVDPYETYDFFSEVHQHCPDQLRWFILFADYGGDDNNVTIEDPAFHALLKKLDQTGRLGIHPSLRSGKDPGVLTSEIENLSAVIGRPVTESRQHFLKLSFPGTCRSLEANGISDDFSLGYASTPGFRAGIASPFPFYDLEQERISPLILHPVTLMDVTFRDHLRLTPQESLSRMELLIDQVKRVNGELVTIWHNESLGEQGRWAGWNPLYKKMAEKASL